MHGRLLFALAASALALSGCLGGGPATNRSQLGFPVVSSIDGVTNRTTGDLALRGADGLDVAADPANATLTVGLGPRLLVRGVVQACRGACLNLATPDGMVVAEGTLVSLHNLSLNARGPEGDSAVFFFENNSQDGAFLRWQHERGEFQLSGPLEALGPVASAGPLSTLAVAPVAGASPLVLATAAMQGLEDALFLRGSAQLVNGSATIVFPPAFQALVKPGSVTAQATPTSAGSGLMVVERGSDHIRVATLDGAETSQSFDYFIQATRASATPFQVVRQP